MKKRTKEEMAEYQRKRRGNVTPTPVTPKIVTPEEKKLVTPAKKSKGVTNDVTPLMKIIEKLTLENEFLKKEVSRLKAGKPHADNPDPGNLFKNVIAEKESRLRRAS